MISAVNTLSTKLEAAKIERNFKEFKYNLDKKSLENKAELMKFVDEHNRMKTLGEICNVYNYEKGKLVLEFNEKERQKDVEEFDLETRKAVANAEAEYGKKLATIGNQFNKKEENYNFNIENKKLSFEISKASLAAQHNIELLENEFKKSNALSKIPMMKYLDENLQVNINMINDFRAERVGQFIAVCKEKVEDFLSAYEKRFEVLVKYNLQENKEMLRAVQYNYDKEAQIIKENIESAEKAGNEAFVNNLNENLNKLNAKLTEQTEFINKTHEDIVTILNNFIFAQREQAARNLELLDKFDEEIVGKYQALNDMAKKDFENSASSQEEYEKLLTDNYSSNSATLNDSYEKSVTAITEEYSSQIAEYEADRNAYSSDYEKAKKVAESEKQAVIDEYNKKREELISRITKDKADEEGKLEKEREQKETELKEIASKIKQKEKESAETEKELKSKSVKELDQAQKEYQAKIKGLAKTEKKNLTVLLKKAVIEQGKDWWEIVEE